MKRPKKPHQQSSQKTEATKCNFITDKLDSLDENGHKGTTNINHFATLFESDNKESTNNRKKPMNPIIVLGEDEEEE